MRLINEKSYENIYENKHKIIISQLLKYYFQNLKFKNNFILENFYTFRNVEILQKSYTHIDLYASHIVGTVRFWVLRWKAIKLIIIEKPLYVVQR